MEIKPLAMMFLSFTLIPVLSAGTEDLDSRRKQLDDLLKEQWEYSLRLTPEFASILGDKRYNDQVSDLSVKAVKADLERTKDFLRRFEAIDTEGFSEQEVLNKTLMARQLKERLEDARFQDWLMPVNQFSGIHLLIAQLPAYLSFDNAKEYQDYLTRLKKIPGMLEQITDLMREGASQKLTPPRLLMEQVVGQARSIASPAGAESPFLAPLQKLPEAIPAADRQRLSQEITEAVQQQVLPAYARFAEFVEKDYIPACRTEPGLWALPDGDARYAAQVRQNTTTQKTPQEIHQLGLDEVARIETEMLGVAKKLGYDDLKSFNAAIEANPELHPRSREEILDLYRKHTARMYEKLPLLFGRLPKARVEVRPVEAFREKEAAGAEYNQGAPDGSRPGVIQVNTGDFEHRLKLDIETTAYHEGVPGHHLQGSIQQELPTLPPFRQQINYNAYTEGWALYSERLGKEVGFFEDPYSYYGHLQDEMLRAIRLVVDTGFHYKRWTRQQVVDFFHDHSGIDEVTVQAETDRYIAIPGQALGYKMGQLKILELRERAKSALADRFDIRAFHDEILGAGPLPLDILEERMNRWVADQRQP